MPVSNKPYDLLSLYGRFSSGRQISFYDEQSLDRFLIEAKNDLSSALSDEILLHGQRTAGMFEAMVRSFGRYKLIKAEDNGQVHSKTKMRAPDFRLVLEDNEQWLVEVKNVHGDPHSGEPRRLMSPAYYSSLEEYARLTCAKLKLAVYWSSWQLWTVIEPRRLLDERGYLRLTMEEAMFANELARLGDLSVGTKAPIHLILETSSSKIDEKGQAEITIIGSHVTCGGKKLSKPEENLALLLIQYGEWEEENLGARVENGIINSIDFEWKPQEESPDHIENGFAYIGRLSRMFSRYYLELTARHPNTPQLVADHNFDWFSPLAQENYAGDTLPLWRFLQKPNYEGALNEKFRKSRATAVSNI